MSNKLEVGSGNRPTPGYLHCDVNPSLPDLDFVCPMHQIPVEDNRFDEVRTVHVIEHVDYKTGLRALQEWYRVLKPGGMCYIDTPNLRRNVKLYLERDKSWMEDFNILHPSEQEMVSINGVPNKTLWVNFKMFSTSDPWNTHYINYDADLLPLMCRNVGFTRTEVQDGCSLIVRAWK